MYNTRKCAQSRSFLLIRFLPASLFIVIFVWKNRRENTAGVLENSASRISRLGRCDIRHDEDLPRGYHEYDDVMADSDNQLFVSIPHVVKYCSSAVHPVSGPTRDPNQTRMFISTVHLQTVRSWDDYTRSFLECEVARAYSSLHVAIDHRDDAFHTFPTLARSEIDFHDTFVFFFSREQHKNRHDRLWNTII